jgi:uncharacterized protein YjdB
MIEYQAHVQDVGWTETVSDGETSGTVGEAKRLEALIVDSDYNLEYKAHVQNVGWQDWVKRGEVAGTTGQGLRMEAFRIKLIDPEQGKHVWYRVHVENVGWTDYAIDGDIVGSVGQSLRMEAVEIRIVDELTDEDFADWLELSKKSKLGEVVFSVATGEDATMTANITDKPIEGGNISDHAQLQPLTMSIPGYIVGDDAQQKLEKLREYMKNSEVLRFVGVDIAQNVMITSLKTGRSANIADGVAFTVDLKEVRIAESVVTVIDEAYVYTQANDLKNGGLQAVLTE